MLFLHAKGEIIFRIDITIYSEKISTSLPHSGAKATRAAKILNFCNSFSWILVLVDSINFTGAVPAKERGD